MPKREKRRSLAARAPSCLGGGLHREVVRLIRRLTQPKRGRPGRKAIFTLAQRRLMMRLIRQEIRQTLRRVARTATP